MKTIPHNLIAALLLIIGSGLLVSCQSATPSPAPQPTAIPATARPPQNTTTVQRSEFSPELLDNIDAQVQALRGLNASQPVERAMQTREELQQSMLELQEQSQSEEDVRNAVLTLAALDLVEPDLDLASLYIDLLTEQVLGFYNQDEKALFVISDAQGFGVLEKITYAHEFDHALQDQEFDLVELGFSNDPEKQSGSGDELLALQALIEGDATLLMQQWISVNLSQEELLEFLEVGLANLDTTILDSVPDILRRSLEFPYNSGLSFVTGLYNQGGWQAVNAAFRTPPASTEQILHPERYPDDRPIAVSLPALTDTLGLDWRLADEDVLGEWYLREYLRAHLDEGVFPASRGWGGDRYAVYVTQQTFDDPSREPEYVLVLSHVWDTVEDAGEFAEAYREYIKLRFGLGGATRSDGAGEWWVAAATTYLEHEADRTLIVVGPDEATVQRVVGEVAP